jgi:predicted enzyme related to lactoylglutathione lyase
MIKAARMVMGAGLAWMVASTAQADVSLFASRVGAVDVAAVEKFYQAAFGLKEVNRLKFPGGLEVMLNWGSTVDAAKKSSYPQIVIMQRESDAVKDAIPHLIFGVTDAAASAAAVKAAGGKMDGEPREFGKTGILIGMGTDPAGNRIELIQQPKQ